MDKENLGDSQYIGRASVALNRLPSSQARPFLRIPPFPGARVRRLAVARSTGVATQSIDVTSKLKRLRVGGAFWGAQPDLPDGLVIVRSAVHLGAASCLGGPVAIWEDQPVPGRFDPSIIRISGDCDPWHVLARASALVTEPEDELGIIAGMLAVPVYHPSALAGLIRSDPAGLNRSLIDAIADWTFQNPFTGEPMDASQAIDLCAFWRQLIDSNRDIVGGLGFAFWKQAHVEPLLWNGSGRFNFLRDAGGVDCDQPVAVWRSKVPASVAAALDEARVPLVDVEDGFLRSRGLGADCIPPLSITVDRKGAYFDPGRPSELECLLQSAKFDRELLERARALREIIVDLGVGKYQQGFDVLPRPAGPRLTILVPGQVEDDRAVILGGCGLTSNLDLLIKVREHSPDAYILYKPHPDVLAGHRRGAIHEQECLRFADEIVSQPSIGSLIAMVDEVHVNTSLAGFEALLRGKVVSTFGVPFYAGWGLTNDFGPVPPRRTAARSLDELVAATLLIYPRYFDPVSGLPCPAEIVVARLVEGGERNPSLLVGMRRLQGKLMRRLRSLVQ